MRPHPFPPAREPAPPEVRTRSRRRRDRRGRGLRGPLAPAGVPLTRTRAERFDELVERSVSRLEHRWERELAEVEFAIADVPPARAVGAAAPDGDPVPLARTVAATATAPTRIVVYRRPLEARASDPAELEELLHDVIVEQVALVFGVSPSAVDPGYADDENHGDSDDEP